MHEGADRPRNQAEGERLTGKKSESSCSFIFTLNLYFLSFCLL